MSTGIEAVQEERARQDAKWGEQNHPDGTGPDELPLLLPTLWVFHDALALDLAVAFTESTDQRFEPYLDDHGHERHNGTWRDVLLEEVFEAIAESDPAKLRAELVQVAAVAVAWVEAIDRRAV